MVNLDEKAKNETKLDVALETFHYSAKIAEHRTALQSKCIDLSIHVTSGLAFVVAGSIVTWIFKESGKTAFADFLIIELAVATILSFYLFIQMMLLTTYIYHTIIIMASSAYIGKLMWAATREQIPDMTRSTGECRFFRISGWFVTNFQPIVLYGSIFVGLLIFVVPLEYVLLAAEFPTTGTLISLNVLMTFLVFGASYFVWGCFLAYVHRHQKRFGRYILDENDRDWDPIAKPTTWKKSP